MTKTKIINLFAGPGAGKSTAAAYIYANLKNIGINAELVREYIKSWAWQEREIGPYDQAKFLGEQMDCETLLLGRVEVIVTDSPVWLCSYYAERYAKPNIRHGIESMVRSYYQQAAQDGHHHINLWVKRTKPYNQAGRYESEEEAKDVDKQLYAFLNDRGVDLKTIDSDFNSLQVALKKLGFDVF